MALQMQWQRLRKMDGAKLGQLGGSATSDAKTDTFRANGARGERPRKNLAAPD